MTSLETVALDQERCWATAVRVKDSNHARFSLMVALSLAGAILEALALQIRAAYPAASDVAGYAGAVALALVLVIRARGLRGERVQAWVLAAAASHSLKSEMYQYRTSSGPYSDHLGGNPEATLLQRRDDILEKVRSIQKYAVEPGPKSVAPLEPLDAEAYISERVNGEIGKFRQFTKNLTKVQSVWLKREYFLVGAGALLAAALTFTHNQAYGAWVAVIVAISLASGVAAKSERYALLLVDCRAMPERLTSILGRWRASHGTLDQLVEQVEAVVLAQAQVWVLGVDDFPKDALDKDSSPRLALHSPVSRAGSELN